MNRPFKCLNSLLIVLMVCFLKKKSRIMNSFKKKKINLLRKENMFSLVSFSKSKFSLALQFCRYCCNRVALVLFVSHWCCSCSACVTLLWLLSHLCHTCAARGSLVSHTCCSYCTCVTRVALVLLVSGTRIVK